MSIKLERVGAKLRARIEAQMRAEDETKAHRNSRNREAIVKAVFAPLPRPTLRQERGPRLNELETRTLRQLQNDHQLTTFHAQAIRFRLANGAWYKPDLWALRGGRLLCWECKCFKAKGAPKGILAVKVAASQYPEVDFWLVTQERGGPLRFERVLP